MLVAVTGAATSTFRDRSDAGRRLGARLAGLGLFSASRPVVLGLPRGGVTVAAEVAAALDGDLDILVARKVAHPRQPELALGALAEGRAEPVWDHALLRRVGLTPADLTGVVAAELDELARRVASYRGDRALPDLARRDVVLVDDGVATGATAHAALRALRGRDVAQLVLAVPVAAPEAVRMLSAESDHVVALVVPPDFVAVGRWYDDFTQLRDDDVRDALRPTAG